jgi:hypothetical protein
MKSRILVSVCVTVVASAFANTTLAQQRCPADLTKSLSAEELKACVNELRATVAELKNSMKDAVVPFASASGCPIGWKQYGPAAGRFIVGVNEDNRHGLSNRKYEATGGDEAHKLTAQELPRLSLALSTREDINLQDRVKVPVVNGGSIVVDPAAKGAPHNTMPPYVALWICKKD